MYSTISTLIGGVGLFLLGMILMTDGLKSLAGDALRLWLARFTGSTRKAVLTGAGLTALIQSSSVTTLATIGFVSAGLLSFQHSIGVIIGANLGTTSTGWIVSLLGLKLSVGKLVLPFIGIGALMKLLGTGKLAHSGTALAGFAVIFVGIDTMQAGMAGLADRIDLAQFGAVGFLARIVLVVIGIVMTILMQSSSAAVATTLTALAAGTISLEQAAALVIGQNMGTTIKAGIAAIGASVPAKRTALIHVIFNVGTGVLAFFLLPLFIWIIALFNDRFLGNDHALSLAAFHTLFNLLGVAIFLPLTRQLAHFAESVISEQRPALTRNLDPSMRAVPSLAVDSAHKIIKQCAIVTLQNTASRMRGEDSPLPLQYLREVQDASHEVADFLARLPAVDRPVLTRLNDVLHALDHVGECALLASNPELLEARRRVPELSRRADHLAALFLEGAQALGDMGPPHPLDISYRMKDAIQYSADARPAILQATLSQQLAMDDALYGLSAQRRLERLTHHAARALHYLHALELPATTDTAQQPETGTTTSTQ